MPVTWEEIVAAVGVALGGDREEGRAGLERCWAATTDTDHAQRTVIAHYLADQQPDLDEEVRWDEAALAAYPSVTDADLAPVGIPHASGLAASLHLNLGDGYRRQGRLDAARGQLRAATSAAGVLGDDGYGSMVRGGIARLAERLAVSDIGGSIRAMATTFQVTFDAADPGALSAFWAEALHYVVPPPPGDFASWDEALDAWGVPADHRGDRAALVDPEGVGPRVFFQKVPEPKTVKNRVHLDLRAATHVGPEGRSDALEAECTRLVALGATRVRRLEGNAIDGVCIVMQDPEGNEFCLD